MTRTPLRLIEALKPDYLIKGADYTVATVVGSELVASYGGKTILVPIEQGHSRPLKIVGANTVADHDIGALGVEGDGNVGADEPRSARDQIHAQVLVSRSVDEAQARRARPARRLRQSLGSSGPCGQT